MTEDIKRGLLENLSYNLQLRRYLSGYTQRDVEEATGVDAVSLSRYERGIAEPLSINLLKLAKFYNTTVDALFLDWHEMRRRIYGFIEEIDHKEEE